MTHEKEVLHWECPMWYVPIVETDGLTHLWPVYGYRLEEIAGVQAWAGTREHLGNPLWITSADTTRYTVKNMVNYTAQDLDLEEEGGLTLIEPKYIHLHGLEPLITREYHKGTLKGFIFKEYPIELLPNGLAPLSHKGLYINYQS